MSRVVPFPAPAEPGTDAGLALYQRQVAAALRPGAPPADAATEVIRASVWHWARLQLTTLCPITATVLHLDGRFDREVTAQLDEPGRPDAVHPWSHRFLARLIDDADEVVAAAARFELACAAPADLAARHPHGWWSAVDPTDLALVLLTGRRPQPEAGHGVWLRLDAPSAADAGGWELVRLS